MFNHQPEHTVSLSSCSEQRAAAVHHYVFICHLMLARAMKIIGHHMCVCGNIHEPNTVLFHASRYPLAVVADLIWWWWCPIISQISAHVRGGHSTAACHQTIFASQTDNCGDSTANPAQHHAQEIYRGNIEHQLRTSPLSRHGHAHDTGADLP